MHARTHTHTRAPCGDLSKVPEVGASGPLNTAQARRVCRLPARPLRRSCVVLVLSSPPFLHPTPGATFISLFFRKCPSSHTPQMRVWYSVFVPCWPDCYFRRDPHKAVPGPCGPCRARRPAGPVLRLAPTAMDAIGLPCPPRARPAVTVRGCSTQKSRQGGRVAVLLCVTSRRATLLTSLHPGS